MLVLSIISVRDFSQMSTVAMVTKNWLFPWLRAQNEEFRKIPHSNHKNSCYL